MVAAPDTSSREEPSAAAPLQWDPELDNQLLPDRGDGRTETQRREAIARMRAVIERDGRGTGAEPRAGPGCPGLLEGPTVCGPMGRVQRVEH